MSIKKKAAQAARRQVRTAVAEYETTLLAKLDRIRVAFKPKPRFLPHKFWRWWVGTVVDIDKLYKNDIKNVETGTEGKAGVEQSQDGGVGA